MHHRTATENLRRCTFTLPPHLVENIERIANDEGTNRSKIVREALSLWISSRIEQHEVTGIITAMIAYQYDPHEMSLIKQLQMIQHNAEKIIFHITQNRIDHTSRFEFMLCRGDIQRIKELAGEIQNMKHVNLVSTKYFVTSMRNEEQDTNSHKHERE